MDRIEFYANDKFYETINGSGPTYQWICTYPLFNALYVRGLIRNKEITDEYVKFRAMMVLITGLGEEDLQSVCAFAYDNAGNKNFDEIVGFWIPFPLTITPGIYLFRDLILPRNYEGFIGKYFIKAIFFT